MPETQGLRVPIKAGQTERVAGWVRSLEGRRGEVARALEREGMVFEAVFLERGAAGDHLVIVNAAASLAAAHAAFQTSREPVDVELRALMAECLDLAAAKPFEHLFSAP